MKYNAFIFLRNGSIAALAGFALFAAFGGCRSKIPAPASVVVDRQQPVNNQPMNNQPMTPMTPVAGNNAPASDNIGNNGGSNAPVSGGASNEPTTPTAPITALDSEIIGLRSHPLSDGTPASGGTKWVANGNGYRAEFRADAGSTTWNRVKIDYNNNKQWDEKWDFKPDGSIKRQISPSDDGNYPVQYRGKNGANEWTREK